MPRLSSSPMARFCFIRFENQVKSAVKQCFSADETRVVVYSTNKLLSATNNVVRPALQKRNGIYQFACHCDISRYIGLLSQKLQEKIKQHISKSIGSFSSSQKRLLPARRCKPFTHTNTQSFASDSDIGLHFIQNPVCAKHYDGSRFSILAQGRSSFHLVAPLSILAQDRSPFHRSALLAIYLLSSHLSTFIKTSSPALCQQKKFVYSLEIVY